MVTFMAFMRCIGVVELMYGNVNGQMWWIVRE